MIYELEQNITEALNNYYKCFDEDGELIVTPQEYDEINKGLVELQNKKWELIDYFLKDRVNKKAENDWLQAEIERLQARIKRNNNKVWFIENYIDYNYKSEYNKPVNVWNFTISYRKSEAVKILDENLIDFKYKKEKLSISIDKTEIKKDLKAWKIVDGAEIENKLNLNIK